MKRIISIVISVSLILSSCTLSAGAIKDMKNIGKFNDVAYVINGIDENELPNVNKVIKEEYLRCTKTRSVSDYGAKLFDYGKTTKEVVHGWMGSEKIFLDNGKETVVVFKCMAQDFVEGSSDCPFAFEYFLNWACIVVTPDSLKQNRAYTVRDGIANGWQAAGGSNSHWGMPTSNQYWFEKNGIWYACQDFDRGFATAEEGWMIAVFHSANGQENPMVKPQGVQNNFDNSDWLAEKPELNGRFVGDIDCNNSVTVSDVVALRNQILNRKNFNGVDLDIADLDESNEITVSDVVMLRNYILFFSGDTFLKPKSIVYMSNMS